MEKSATEIRDLLKADLKKRGLAPIVRTNNAGCLDACEHGATLVIYPDGIWYGHVTPEDVPEIVEKTVISGEVISRLRISDPRYAPSRESFSPLSR
jgi:(2Fe-2S) ferredoxin